jgi:hypothetical protein
MSRSRSSSNSNKNRRSYVDRHVKRTNHRECVKSEMPQTLPIMNHFAQPHEVPRSASSCDPKAPSASPTVHNILLVGHSFISRVRNFFRKKPIDIDNMQVSYCCRGGWHVSDCEYAVAHVPSRNIQGAVVYVDIGTNDLSHSGCNPHKLAMDILRLGKQILKRGAKCVYLAETLDRFGKGRRGLRSDFTKVVQELNATLLAHAKSQENIAFWAHIGIGHMENNFDQGGVDLNEQGLAKYRRSRLSVELCCRE